MEKLTALQGSWNLKVNKSLPLPTSQSLTEASADPVISVLESSAAQRARGDAVQVTQPSRGRACWMKMPKMSLQMEQLTGEIASPNCAVVPIVGAHPVAVL